MRHKEKRRCSPTDFYSVGAERGRAWTELRCARSLCLAREGTACTKVVLQSRVLFRDVVVVGVCYSPWWTFAKLDGYVLAEVTSLLFDVWVVFCWFLEGLVLLPLFLFPVVLSLVCAEVALCFPSLPASLVLVGAVGGRRGCSSSCWCSSRFLASVAVSR